MYLRNRCWIRTCRRRVGRMRSTASTASSGGACSWVSQGMMSHGGRRTGSLRPASSSYKSLGGHHDDDVFVCLLLLVVGEVV